MRTRALDGGRTVWSNNSIGESRVKNDSNPPGEFRWRVFYFSVLRPRGDPAEQYWSGSACERNQDAGHCS
jgi:hypothetical protein